MLLICNAAWPLSAQSFLNGDFENNFAGNDQININNSTYNLFMPNSFGYGSYKGGGVFGGNIDIIRSNIYCGLAQQGNWYVALTGGGTDAISLKLSEPLIQGHSYTISFYDRYGFGTVTFPFLIGLSTVENDFGTQIYSAPDPQNCSWTQKTFSFISPDNGQFISLKLAGGSINDIWCHLDNFTIQETLATTSFNQNKDFEIFPNPTSDELNIKQFANQYEIKSIRILNAQGQELYQSRHIGKIDVSGFANGSYILEVTTDNKKLVFKFLKL
jgi:hypothetical protein